MCGSSWPFCYISVARVASIPYRSGHSISHVGRDRWEQFQVVLCFRRRCLDSVAIGCHRLPLNSSSSSSSRCQWPHNRVRTKCTPSARVYCVNCETCEFHVRDIEPTPPHDEHELRAPLINRTARTWTAVFGWSSILWSDIVAQLQSKQTTAVDVRHNDILYGRHVLFGCGGPKMCNVSCDRRGVFFSLHVDARSDSIILEFFE